jgi:hypothetical protein
MLNERKDDTCGGARVRHMAERGPDQPARGMFARLKQ